MYNIGMETKRANENVKCNRNPIQKILRILLSLAVIGLGIYDQNPIGLLGFLTLYTAFTGNCGLNIKFNRSKYDNQQGRHRFADEIETWEPEKNN